MLTSAKCYFCNNGAKFLCVNGENAVFCNNGERKAGVNGGKRHFCGKGDSMRGYKAFNSDLTCRGFQYEIGKTYTLEEPDKLEICCNGFHFCSTIAGCYVYYPTDGATRICEVEALGEIQGFDYDDKMVTNKIRIVREITGPEKHANLTNQDGYMNSGCHNSGNHNSGSYNAGNRNSGGLNSGNNNSGMSNSGDYNSGNYNSGNYNSGDDNSGRRNSGNHNSGDHNSGKYNFGNWNTGDRNTGYHNSGDYNSGRWNSGCFNTYEKPKINMFNKPSDWTMDDWLWSEAREIVLGLFWDEENKQDRWDNLNEEDKTIVMSLPNFDADIFEECTGIRVE